MKGELFSTAFEYGKLPGLRNRAVFVREAKWYVLFGDLIQEDPDFWYALESGIPLIQARALAALHLYRNEDRISVLTKFNDIHTIPWTPQLIEEMRTIISSTNEEGHYRNRTLAYLRGYLGENVLLRARHYAAEYGANHFCGVVERKLKGEFTTEPDRDVDQICNGRNLSGLTLYMPHIHRQMAKSRFHPYTEMLLYEVVGIMEFYQSYPDLILGVLKQNGIIKKPAITRRSIGRMEQLLRRQDFLEAFKDTYLPELYRYICGYLSSVNPTVGGGPGLYKNTLPTNASIQQLVIYSGVSVEVSPLDERIMAASGRYFIKKTISLRSYGGMALRQMANPALAKLLNAGDFDSSKGEEWNELTSEILKRLIK